MAISGGLFCTEGDTSAKVTSGLHALSSEDYSAGKQSWSSLLALRGGNLRKSSLLVLSSLSSCDGWLSLHEEYNVITPLLLTQQEVSWFFQMLLQEEC